MPRVKIPNIPWKVSFYSFDRREPRHVHVSRERMECKFWIEPAVQLAWNRGFAEHELRDILRMIEANFAAIQEAYEHD
jgi:hypothetical protein